jgi:NADPH-dependent 2,4-dienoyl-CoA reductase/sulfur reductase-like enzyme
LESCSRSNKNDGLYGGGPAGMEAARVSALKGHNVTLYEKQAKLGGLMNDISVPEFKKDIKNLLNYYLTQINKLQVKVVYKEATVKTIIDSEYDAVILATGSEPIKIKEQEIKNNHVITVLDVLQGAKTNDKVIVVGGGKAGCDVALYLANQNKNVIIIEKEKDFLNDTDKVTKKAIKYLLQENKIGVHLGFKFQSIVHNGVIATNHEGEEILFAGNTVVLSLGMKSNNSLMKKLEENNIKFYAIGDCVKPRKIYDAIYEANIVTRNL